MNIYRNTAMTNSEHSTKNKCYSTDNRHLYFTALHLTLQPGYCIVDIDEDMWVIGKVTCSYIIPRFIVDRRFIRAYEFVSEGNQLSAFTEKDIDWDSIKKIPDKVLQKVHDLYSPFHTYVGKFHNGVAQVDWVVNPDGMYYADSDGYGMTNDKEVELTAFIDRHCKIVVPFRNINDDWNVLKAMRKEAEDIVNNINKSITR